MRVGSLTSRLACATVMWIGLAVCLFAQATSVTNQLKYFRGVYETELKKIVDDGNAKVESWPEDYIREVTAVRTKARRAGDLDGVMAVETELKRFKASKDFPDQVIATAPEAIRAIQINYRDKPRLLVLDRDQRVLEFAGRYRDRLTAMQSDLTKANRIEDALLVNAEIKRLAGSPAVTAAEFSLAEEEARKKKAEAAVTPPPVQPPPVPTPQTGPARFPPGTDAGARPPAPPPVAPPEPKKAGPLAPGFKMVEKAGGLGSPMKPLPLTATPQLRIPKVRVDVAMDEREPSDSASSGSVYGSYRYRAGNTRLVFQASVRATTTNEYENTKMVVQYFTKQLATKGGGRIEANEASRITTPLPKIASQPVTFECPPFQYWSSTSKYRSLYHSSNYKSGDDFYGAIVSVFDDEGKLLFQGASMNSLEKLGADAP